MKTNIRFSENLKKYLLIAAAIILIGIIFNIIFGVQLDIQFAGGTIVNYTYTGDIDETELRKCINNELTESHVSISISDSLLAGENVKDAHMVAVQFPGSETITPEEQQSITESLNERYPDNNFKLSESSSVDATMGLMFFLKCLTAIAIASVIMIIYVAIRFKKIKGLSAGCTALLAIVLDVIAVYITFVIFRMPIDSNFIAVVLTIIGYSLNDTIVIYDRVRENRSKMGRDATPAELYNASANQVLKRTFITSLTTIFAIVTVLIVAYIYRLDSVVTFALPMTVGIIHGCFSSICIAGPLWVAWQNHKAAKASK